MLKTTFVRANANQASGETISRHSIFTPADVAANLDHGWAFLRAGQAQTWTPDARAQLWVIYGGRGEAEVAGRAMTLRELDAVLIPPGVDHRLVNNASRDLTIFWAAWKPVGKVLGGTYRAAVEPFDRGRLKPAHMDTFYYFEPFSTEAMGGPDRFTTGWGLVGGGVASELHRHPTAELYVFLRGATVQQVDLQCAAVKATDSVMVPADTLHNLLNYTDRDVLLYWIEVIPGSLPGRG